MVWRSGSPYPNWQFARQLPQPRFTTRLPPISNFLTDTNLKKIRIGIKESLTSLSTDTKEAEKRADFPDIATARSSHKYHERKGSGGMKANAIPYQIL